jgi:hypothetical protein
MFFSPFLWRSIYISNGGYLQMAFVSCLCIGPHRSAQISKATPLPAGVGDKPASIRAFKILDWFADGYVSASADDSSHLLAGDQRYAITTGSTTPLWGLEFDPALPNGFKGWGSGIRGRPAEREAFWKDLVNGEGYRPMNSVPATVSSP